VFPLDDKTEIHRVFEGVVIRAVLYNGVVYRITHRKIIPIRSHWGGSPTFSALYDSAGGPKDDQLFDMNKRYSPFCHFFIVVHPSLLIASRQTVKEPYVVYLGHHKNSFPFDESLMESKPSNTFTTFTKISGTVSASGVHQSQVLSLEEANKHLGFGYFEAFESTDERQLTGEAVIINRKDDNGAIVDIVKVHSPAFEWRVKMRGEDPNIYHRFYDLITISYKNVTDDKSWKSFTDQFMTFDLYEEDSIKKIFIDTVGAVTLQTKVASASDYSNKEDRIFLIWFNLMLSLPPHLRAANADVLERFRNDRNELIIWLQELEAKHESVDELDKMNIIKRSKDIIITARNLARQTMREGKNFGTNGVKISISSLIKNTIRNFISKEYGASLYSMIRNMQKIKKIVVTEV